ncbi:CKLF-like MARVEL transmembrane domain-containing protein 1 isoform X1 [Bos taurus]|uniref:CKLF-like MARVEL transmembrane domain-containing protein 1 isoform X1 n=1 Tax=Bos taurus TaxID=9913 RepID=UPI000383D192|nr:CKLF-like MARVEL transmembrane domain-containing protein 1 isoform X1 [Bos taurus]
MQTLKPKPKARPFCLSVKGHVKLLRLALAATSMTLFILAQAPEPYIVVTGFEVASTFFFILLYILRLDRLISCLFWPLLDIINSAVAAVFMIVVSVLALIPETTTHTVLGGGLLIGAFIFFIIAEAPESYIAITILETCIVVFFILIYMLTLHHLMTYLHWPLLDLINSFITAVFLLIVAILAIQEKERRHLFYIGGALCLTAATVCVIDATLVTKTMRNNLKKALGIKMITSGPLAPEPTPPTRTPTRGGPNAPTRATVKQRSQWQPSSKATSQRNPGGRL